MAKIQKKFIESNAVDESKIQLSNEGALKSRNAADSADVEILKVNSSDRIEFSSVPQVAADAVTGNDLVRKSQIDGLLQGIKPKEAARVASTADTALTGAATLTIDGVSLANGDRVLLKDQTDASQNGVYDVSGIGAAYVLTRSVDFDEVTPINEIEGAYVAIQTGTDNSGKVFVQSGTVASLGSDDINFIFFNSTTGLIGGDGVSISGTNVSVDHDGEGFTFSSGQLSMELEDSTLSKSATGIKIGTIDVANNFVDDSITADKLDLASMAGAGLSEGASDDLQVNVDDSTIEIATDSLQVKDAGISKSKLKLGNSAVDAESIDAEAFQLSGNFAASAGTVIAGDSVETALEKLDGNIAAISVPVAAREAFTLDSTDISNGYVTLAQTALVVTMVAPKGGPVQFESDDYTVSGAQVTFAGDLSSELAVGDKLAITYEF